MGEWGRQRANSSGAAPVTQKTRVGASCEEFLKRGTCTQYQHSRPTTRRPGGAGEHNTTADALTYIAVSDEWRDSSAKSSTLPAIQLPGEAIDHVPFTASMLWPQFCIDGAKHDVGNGTLVVDPGLQSNAEAQRWFQHYTPACIRNCSPWLNVV